MRATSTLILWMLVEPLNRAHYASSLLIVVFERERMAFCFDSSTQRCVLSRVSASFLSRLLLCANRMRDTEAAKTIIIIIINQMHIGKNRIELKHCNIFILLFDVLNLSIQSSLLNNNFYIESTIFSSWYRHEKTRLLCRSEHNKNK